MSITKRMTKYLNESYRVDEARAVFPERRTRYSKWELFDALYEAISRINDYSAENISDTNDTKILSDLQSAKDEYVQSIETLVQNYFPDVSWDYGYWKNPIFDGKNKEQNTIRFIHNLNQSIDVMAHIKSYIADEEAIRHIDDVCQPALDNLVQRFGDATGNKYSPLPESCNKRSKKKINEDYWIIIPAENRYDEPIDLFKFANKYGIFNSEEEVDKEIERLAPDRWDAFITYRLIEESYRGRKRSKKLVKEAFGVDRMFKGPGEYDFYFFIAYYDDNDEVQDTDSYPIVTQYIDSVEDMERIIDKYDNNYCRDQGVSGIRNFDHVEKVSDSIEESYRRNKKNRKRRKKLSEDYEEYEYVLFLLDCSPEEYDKLIQHLSMNGYHFKEGLSGQLYVSTEEDIEVETILDDWDIPYRIDGSRVDEKLSYRRRRRVNEKINRRRKPLRESIQITNEEAETIIGMFDNTYDFLYDHDDNVAGFDEAMEYGEWLIANEKDLISKLIQAREDYFMSDREVAALGFTVNDWLNA